MRYAFSCCVVTESYEPEHTYKFTGPCLKTGKPYSVTVPAEGLYKIHKGELIQKAFPDLSSDDREFLISGYSPEGWSLIYGLEDEDESSDVYDDDGGSDGSDGIDPFGCSES